MSLVDRLKAIVGTAPGAEHEDLVVIEPDGDRLPDGAWEELENRYASAVEEVASSWGPPDFEGSWRDAGFPKWHHWVAHLAVWRRGGIVAYIECDHQDNELPAILCIGALTDEEQAELTNDRQ